MADQIDETEGLTSETPIEELKEKSVSELTPEEIKELEKAIAEEAKAEEPAAEVPSWEPTDEPAMEAPALYPIEFFNELIRDMRIDFDTRSTALHMVRDINATKDISVADLLTQALQVENYLVTGQAKLEDTPPV